MSKFNQLACARLPTGPMILTAAAITAFHLLPFLTKLAASATFSRETGFDFTCFYFAADAAINFGRSPYSAAAMQWWTALTGIPLWIFWYPPTSIVWFYPFALFPHHMALVLFQAISAACLIALLVIVGNRMIEAIRWRAWRVILIGALFSFAPLSVTFAQAQVNTMVTLLILLAWLEASALGSDKRVAFYLFLATILKTYPGLFLVLFLIRRRYGVLVWFVVFALLDLAVSAAVLPSAVWTEFLTNIAAKGGYGSLPDMGDSRVVIYIQNFNALFMRLDPEHATLEATVAACIVMAMSLHLIVVHRREQAPDFYGLGFTLLSAASLLIAPVTWTQHFVFLIPPLAYIARYASERVNTRRATIAAQLALLSILVLLAYAWPFDQMRPLANPFAQSAPVLGPLEFFLFGAALAACATSRRLRQLAGPRFGRARNGSDVVGTARVGARVLSAVPLSEGRSAAARAIASIGSFVRRAPRRI